MSEPVTRRECDLAQQAIKSSIKAEVGTVSAEIKALRRELVLAVTISTTLISIFITVMNLVGR